MGPLNRVYWYYDQMVNANSCEWIEIDGRLDIDTLRQAAHILAQRHPVLNSRLHVGLPWRFEWVGDVGHLPIDIRFEQVDAACHPSGHPRPPGGEDLGRTPAAAHRPAVTPACDRVEHDHGVAGDHQPCIHRWPVGQPRRP